MTKTTTAYDVAIIGAGAAGLMAAVQAGARGRKVLVVEHTDKIGEKIEFVNIAHDFFTKLDADFRHEPHIKLGYACYYSMIKFS